MNYPDFRDRVSVYLWVILAVLAAELYLQLPARTLSWTVFGTPLSIPVTTPAILGVPLLILAASGMEGVVRAHPRALAGELRHSWILWSLPSALVLTAVTLLPTIPARITWLGGLVLTGAALGVVSIATYHTIDDSDAHYRAARVVLNLVTYAIALVVFLLVYQTRTRSLLSGSVTTVAGTLLALELLRSSADESIGRILQYGLICGLILGEATWALNYWQLPGLTGGLLLMLLFYVLVGLAQQGLARTLRRQVVLEFLFISIVGLVLIWLFAPH